MCLVCVCNRSTGSAILPNSEGVEFQPQSGITSALDSVDYCYVPLPSPPLILYSPPYPPHEVIFPPGCCLSPSKHIHLPHEAIRPPRHCPYLSQHSVLPLLFPAVPLTPTAWISHPIVSSLLPATFFQNPHKLLLRRLLEPKCISPGSSPLLDLLSWAHFKDCPQRHPLCHSYLLSPYVGRFWPSSRRFLHYFCPGRPPWKKSSYCLSSISFTSSKNYSNTLFASATTRV